MNSFESDKLRDQHSGRLWHLTALMIAAAFAIRLTAALGELWLDEVWALQIARGAASPIQVFTMIRLDNHLLYTFYLQPLAAHLPPLIYRLPSVLSFLFIILGLRILSREKFIDRTATLCLTVIFSFSYVLIAAAAEARGYALAVSLSFLSYCWLRTGLEKNLPKFSYGVFFYIASVIAAFLAQPLAVQMLFAAIVWSVWHWHFRQGLCYRKTAVKILTWHSVPVLVFLGYYIFHLRLLQSGGGDIIPWQAALSNFIHLLSGLPENLLPNSVMLPLTALLVLTIVAWLIIVAKDISQAVFLVLIVIAAPILLFSLKRDGFFFPRYFILNGFFILFFTGLIFARTWKLSARSGKIVLAVIACLFLFSNAVETNVLLRHGRSRYQDLLSDILAADTSETINIAGDHDFRHPLMLDHATRYFADQRKLVYHKSEYVPTDGVEWLLFSEAPAGEMIISPAGTVYRHQKTYVTARNSGYPLYLYRRSE